MDMWLTGFTALAPEDKRCAVLLADSSRNYMSVSAKALEHDGKLGKFGMVLNMWLAPPLHLLSSVAHTSARSNAHCFGQALESASQKLPQKPPVPWSPEA